MPIFFDRARSRAADPRSGKLLTIGLVNNMPDAAFEATERQFLDLIRVTAPDVSVHLKLLVIPEVRRISEMQPMLAARYRDIAELWQTPVDGLIVTGTEPRADSLIDEPYWPAMTKLVDWARDNTISTIWSCLAAHAAVLHADGIARRALADKMFGVFGCETVTAHPLMEGVSPLCVPHSRYNDLPASELAARGYDLLAQSAAAGVDTFVRAASGASLFVFFQGHPEYEADSLLREYRRDINRYLRGDREDYPAVPQGYFSNDAMALANIFRARAIAERHAERIAEFPMAPLAAALDNTWRHSAVAIYRNWIAYLSACKAGRPPAAQLGPKAPAVIDKPAGRPLSNRQRRDTYP